eukprot:1377336-Heterocapsa_arctica.AAC.1
MWKLPTVLKRDSEDGRRQSKTTDSGNNKTSSVRAPDLFGRTASRLTGTAQIGVCDTQTSPC